MKFNDISRFWEGFKHYHRCKQPLSLFRSLSLSLSLYIYIYIYDDMLICWAKPYAFHFALLPLRKGWFYKALGDGLKLSNHDWFSNLLCAPQFFSSSRTKSRYLSSFMPTFFPYGLLKRQNLQEKKFLFFLLKLGLFFWQGLGDAFVFKSLRELYVRHTRIHPELLAENI